MEKLNLDCFVIIFNELRDKKSLHSCLLVNKEWCHLIVPILWKNFFYYEEIEEDKTIFYNTILSLLSSSTKQILNDNDIKLPLTKFLKPPLFNYISFCKFPKYDIVNGIISMILKNNNNHDKRYLLEQEIYKSFIIQCKNIKELYWKTSQPLPLFPGASTCFSQLHKLNINLDYVNSNSLQEMAKYCKSLNELSVRNPKDSTGLISLIDAQKNLKEIFLYSIKFRERTYEKLSNTLSRKVNLLKLELSNIIIIPPSFLKSLINLTTIYIFFNEVDEQDDDIKKIKEFQRCLAISEFPNLQFLSIYWLLSFKELAKLIEKTNENLLHLDIYNTHRNVKNTGMLIISIANNCPKIKTLRTYIEPKDFIYVKSLLLNCKYLEVVKFDSLYAFINLNDNILGDELLNILAEFSPKFLTNITISAIWKYSIDGFIRLFESYKERNLRHFNLCKNYDYDITEDHKVIIKKYIDEGIIRNSTCTFY
ncbi:uncharacterized protein OCT59_028802 [Rhizophagus irregularis]|uniref:F-box domain-containing protein n=5 Tax=Rhizophagus irregularis TaxID=588596 RepID=A0A2H5UCG7_RHIID|nr:hypothetical protein GLOIN_2v1790656 [Rhizophagus irregularis DAOM 181602=DAOM 197198]POG58237.1 hypothetical protein GLOIN_2v1790656 [Rhizophagus irregularis DAOM 181602=DAOM 197198]UZO08548.1 hypothetical protein OCT59_028802 [Rhizophagus irregularis]|eukprot:XP_025165103.1 hypothetical protein GLOIN_2v1790656 [Rhizophagus irregularis DAOM 181602=DAOM 197198]